MTYFVNLQPLRFLIRLEKLHQLQKLLSDNECCSLEKIYNVPSGNYGSPSAFQSRSSGILELLLESDLPDLNTSVNIEGKNLMLLHHAINRGIVSEKIVKHLSHQSTQPCEYFGGVSAMGMGKDELLRLKGLLC